MHPCSKREKKVGHITHNIIFDVDGTLWDTTQVVTKSWNKAITEVGGTKTILTAAVFQKEFGKTLDIIADDLFPDADAGQKEILVQRCCAYEHEALLNGTENLLFPHVTETLRSLSERCRLFIVSNCQCGYIELFMEKGGVEPYITDIECYGNTGRGKGENLRLLMERNHLKEAVYVGDTQGDYEATVFAGIPFIFAKYGFGAPESYSLAISEIKELLSIF